MSFDSIPVVEDTDFYLDLAFRRAKMSAARIKGTKKRGEDKVKKTIKMEMARISTVMDLLGSRLYQIVEEFPSIEHMNPFYSQLIKLTLDHNEIRKSLGAVHWAVKNVKKLGGQYNNKIKGCESIKLMSTYRKEYYGRVSSIMKQIKKDFVVLGKARAEIVNFPTIKELPTICITGFPNVGKSTLLKKLTGADAEIKNYAFTTKKLNFGYLKTKEGRLQFIDTPGTLARRDKMNWIERLAYMVMELSANVLVYIWDVTDTYPIEQQEQLLKEIKKFKKPIIEFVSKTDIADPERVKELAKKRKGLIKDTEKLMKKINSELEQCCTLPEAYD